MRSVGGPHALEIQCVLANAIVEPLQGLTQFRIVEGLRVDGEVWQLVNVQELSQGHDFETLIIGAFFTHGGGWYG